MFLETEWMKGLAILLFTALALSALAFPYLLTIWSDSSFCVADTPQIISGEQKVSAVLDFLVSRAELTPVERARIDPATCCRLDKGGRELPPIGVQAFIVAGESHLVHVPAALIPRYRYLISNAGELEGLFGVTSCGAIVSAG